MTSSALYKQTEYGKFTSREFAEFLLEDDTGKDWLEEMARQFLRLAKMEWGIRDFGMEQAKEVVISSIVTGYFTPKFAKKAEEK